MIGIADVAGGLSPRDKLQRVRELQADGEIVAMIGDGINDTPVLSGADVSVAMGDGARAARASADMILLGSDLSSLSAGVKIARKTLAIIRQNLLWAVTYNVLAIPAAAAGWVAPWMAAIGMSASSLLVVANSLRLARMGDELSGE
jgi:Cu2+-exporting ATPase